MEKAPCCSTQGVSAGPSRHRWSITEIEPRRRRVVAAIAIESTTGRFFVPWRRRGARGRHGGLAARVHGASHRFGRRYEPPSLLAAPSFPIRFVKKVTKK